LDGLPQIRANIFKKIRPGYLELVGEKAAIETTIYESPEFIEFITHMNSHFDKWRKKNAETLRHLRIGCHPKEIITILSEELLAHYTDKPLINKYDIFQHLMDFWTETMQDDCYIIASDGWKAETHRIIEKDKKGKEKDKGWACDLVPKNLIVTRYFPGEQKTIDDLTAKLESIATRISELEEENSGEEGVFSDMDKINKANVTVYLKDIKNGKEAEDEVSVLKLWLKLNGEEADIKKLLKDADVLLDSHTYLKYPQLTETEIKTLVVDDKWIKALDSAIQLEIESISHELSARVKQLAERYENPLPQISDMMVKLEAKVDCHLERMGFSWK